jgi:hypothetical protein
MRKFIFLALTFGLALQAFPVSFQVNVDTSTLAGTTGNVDFAYIPGIGVVDTSFVTIDFFAPGGQLNGVRQISGDVTGFLPGSITIANTNLFNDYFEGFTFTNALSFKVTFDGPPPGGTADTPSTFAFTLFAADETTPLLGNGPNGEYAIGTVDPAGVVTFSAPEAGTFALFGLGFVTMAIRLRNRSYGRKA